MAECKYKLYVDDDMVQFSRELSGLSLLRDPLIRIMCPNSIWKVTVGDMSLNVSQYDPNISLVNKTINYFDGSISNIFKICNGIGKKKFSVIEYDVEDNEMFKNHMKNLVGELRQNSKNFDGVVNDDEISNFILNSKDIVLICAVSEYAPLDFMNVWIRTLKNNGYDISDLTHNSFRISFHSWCLSNQMTSYRTIHREDIDKINFNFSNNF